MSDYGRGRSQRIGEGRRTHSRSSSLSSCGSPRARRLPRPPSPALSVDEPSTIAIVTTSADEEGSSETAPLVRPPMGFKSAFGSFGSSSAFSGFSRQTSQNEYQSHSQQGLSLPYAESQGVIKPTGVHHADAISERTTAGLSPAPSTSTSMAMAVPAVTEFVPLSLHNFVSPQPGIPLVPAVHAHYRHSSTPAAVPSSIKAAPTMPQQRSWSVSSDDQNEHEASGTGIDVKKAVSVTSPKRERLSKKVTKPQGKRGDWRVSGYVNNRNAYSSPEPFQQQAQNTGQYGSAFRATGYGKSAHARNTSEPSYVPPNVVRLDEKESGVGPDMSDFIALGGAPPSLNTKGRGAGSQVSLGQNQQELINTQPNSPAIAVRNLRSASKSSAPSVPEDKEQTTTANLVPPLSVTVTIPESSVPVVRLVSVVIEDYRLGMSDEQLVEVKVPLRSAKDDTFWADAIDVCNLLQNGPSRIDGPAKVYTFRGTYRQYFLRVSADNKDNFVSANLGVSAKRVLRVYVEGVNGPIQLGHPYTLHPGNALPVIDTHQLASPAPSISSDGFSAFASPSSDSAHISYNLKRGHDGSPATSGNGHLSSAVWPTESQPTKRSKLTSSEASSSRSASNAPTE